MSQWGQGVGPEQLVGVQMSVIAASLTNPAQPKCRADTDCPKCCDGAYQQVSRQAPVDCHHNIETGSRLQRDGGLSDPG